VSDTPFEAKRRKRLATKAAVAEQLQTPLGGHWLDSYMQKSTPPATPADLYRMVATVKQKQARYDADHASLTVQGEKLERSTMQELKQVEAARKTMNTQALANRESALHTELANIQASLERLIQEQNQ